MQTEFSKTPPFLSKNTQGFKKPRPFNKSPFFKNTGFQKPPSFSKSILFIKKPQVFKTSPFQNPVLSKNTDHSKKPWLFTKKSCFQKPRPFPLYKEGSTILHFISKIMDTNVSGDENSWEWSDPEADEIIRNINEEEILDRVYGIGVRPTRYQLEALSRERSDPQTDEIIPNNIISNIEVQTERGQKRKHQCDDKETESEDEQGQHRLNDTVVVDINHVVVPKGSGKSRLKRTAFNSHNYLKQKRTVIRIDNTDDLCLARALAVAIARIEKDPKYNQVCKSNRPVQRQRALALHQAANVPLGPCGIDEVKLFQDYLIDYQIIVVSGTYNYNIIYPPQPPGTDEKPSISLYYHNNHFDVITKLPGFLGRGYFCHRCHKAYNTTTDHICTSMCRKCRGFECVWQGKGIPCNECNRVFKNQMCYDRHKNQPINGGGRTVCQVIRKCEKCSKPMDVRHLNDKGHICGPMIKRKLSPKGLLGHLQ